MRLVALKAWLKAVPGLVAFKERVERAIAGLLLAAVSDKAVLRARFRERFGRDPNLRHPVTFNEKVIWRTLYDRRSVFAALTDKYLVRDYVAKAIGKDYLPRLWGLYSHPAEIDFDGLPDRFVLKCTHDSGSVFCRSKPVFDQADALRRLDQSLRRNYYTVLREWHYKQLQPRILCEEYLIFPQETRHG